MEILSHVMRAMTRLFLQTGSMAFTIVCMVLTPAAAAAEGDSLEYAVKAAYLYKFGIYVEWPSGAFAAPTSPLNLCVVGDDPFGPTLDAAVNGQRIENHPIVIRRVKTLTRDVNCHIVYAGTADAQRSIDTARGAGALTVSDMRGAGIISFVIKDNRVRFNIDEEAAAQSGLTISSKLLGLALNVKPRQSKEGR